MITISIEHIAGGWDVAEMVAPDGHGGIATFRRGIDWRPNAAVVSVVTAIALLKLRMSARQPIFLSTRGGELEAKVVRRCRAVLRSPREAKHWSIPLFAGEFGSRFGRTPLESAIVITGASVLTLAPRADALDHFQFVVGPAAADPRQLASFCGLEPQPTPPDSPAADAIADHHDEPSALRRTASDNGHGRPILAICGSATHESLDPALIDMVCDGLAQHLGRDPWHVLHGPRGVGIDTVNKAVNRHQATDLTSTLMVGLNVQIVAPADVVIVIGGSERTSVEVRIALERGKSCLPVRATGGAAAECWDTVGSREFAGLTRDEYEELGRVSGAKAICATISRILTRLARSLRPPRR